jgi:hypothetical protein
LAGKAPKKPQKPKVPAKPRRPKGFRDVQGQRQFTSPDVLSALFERYGFACAFTGTNLGREAEADPRGYLLNLSDDPDTLDPTLLIPATLDAIFAFEHGHLALGPTYNFLANLERIAPEFADKLNAIGRLRLPSDPSFYPSQSALTPHLVAFTSGRKPRE